MAVPPPPLAPPPPALLLKRTISTKRRLHILRNKLLSSRAKRVAVIVIGVLGYRFCYEFCRHGIVNPSADMGDRVVADHSLRFRVYRHAPHWSQPAVVLQRMFLVAVAVVLCMNFCVFANGRRNVPSMRRPVHVTRSTKKYKYIRNKLKNFT